MCDAATDTRSPSPDDDDAFEVVGRNGRTVRAGGARRRGRRASRAKTQYDTTRSTLGETLDRLQVADDKGVKLTNKCKTYESQPAARSSSRRKRPRRRELPTHWRRRKPTFVLLSTQGAQEEAFRQSQERTELVDAGKEPQQRLVTQDAAEYYVKLDHARPGWLLNAEFILANARGQELDRVPSRSARGFVGRLRCLTIWERETRR